jgi:hypothetical protein
MAMFVAAAGILSSQAIPARTGDDSPEKLGMTTAVVCKSITGYKDYVALDEPARTRDEKLLIYYEPLEYATEQVGREHQAHLTQDVKLRKRGEKKVIWQKNDLVKYQPKSNSPPTLIYLSNTIALKAYEPGDYDLEIILHDRISKGPVATQVVRFTIKPIPKPAESAKDEAKDRKPASGPH